MAEEEEVDKMMEQERRFGAIWGPFWGHLGSFWGVLSLFGVILGWFVPIWGDFGVILGCGRGGGGG